MIVSKKNLSPRFVYYLPIYFWVSQDIVWTGSDQKNLRYRTPNIDDVGWLAGHRLAGRTIGMPVPDNDNTTTLWLHLASWNLPDFQLS